MKKIKSKNWYKEVSKLNLNFNKEDEKSIIDELSSRKFCDFCLVVYKIWLINNNVAFIKTIYTKYSHFISSKSTIYEFAKKMVFLGLAKQDYKKESFNRSEKITTLIPIYNGKKRKIDKYMQFIIDNSTLKNTL